MVPKYLRNPSGKQEVYPSGGCFIKGWEIYNGSAAVAFVQVFKKASANVTLGTTAPDFVIPVKTVDRNGVQLDGEGIEMSAFTYAVTTEDDNATAPTTDTALATVDVTFFVK